MARPSGCPIRELKACSPTQLSSVGKLDCSFVARGKPINRVSANTAATSVALATLAKFTAILRASSLLSSYVNTVIDSHDTGLKSQLHHGCLYLPMSGDRIQRPGVYRGRPNQRQGRCFAISDLHGLWVGSSGQSENRESCRRSRADLREGIYGYANQTSGWFYQ